MGKQIKTTINRFDGGRATDKRVSSTNKYSITKHFDTFSNSEKLIPIRGMASDSTGQTKIGNLLVGTDGIFYGLGTDVNNPTQGDIYKKATYAGVWAELANSKSGGVVSYATFLEFQSYFYYWSAVSGGSLAKMKTDGSSQNGTFQSSIGFSTIKAQAVVHPKDGVAYFPYDNKIASLQPNGTTWSATALTIPDTRFIITSLCPFGNYLAIAIMPVNGESGGGSSQVLLWDRDSSVTTLSESIDWGSGNLKVLNNLNGVLIGVSDLTGTISAGATNRDNDPILIKASTGGAPILLETLNTEKQTTTNPDSLINSIVNFIYNDKMYFSVNLVGGSTSPAHYGLWAVGRDSSGGYRVSLENLATNGATDTGVLACAIFGDYISMVHTAVGTLSFSYTTALVSALSEAYTATSIYESLVFNQGDTSTHKKWLNAFVTHRPLRSGESVVLKYRKNQDIDNESAGWTTVFTSDTDNASYKEAINISGVNLPQFYEIQFRIESTGGAEITGFGFTSEIVNDGFLN